ncbi:non-ribosomal peptide synthetase [Aquimarina sediminis]|uniref:non-ribosomal peptide synthetase n=1 Tax=Aquimarina sediminis TaxID=2070536 RepID=UPI000CA01AA5|nr:non-ribosomal peptide synthetase [Aquimarina sediminis]
MNSNILHLFKELKKLDANLYLEEGVLKLNIKQGLLTQEIADTIKSNKGEIIALLSERNNKDYFGIEATAIKNAYPVSSAQYRLWVLSQFEGSSAAYNLPYSVKLEGDYDIPNFKKAIRSVIERHEILRTVFRENQEGVLQQLVIEQSDFDIVYKDFRKKENQEKCAKEYIKNDSYVSFDLENGPLIRVCLLQLTDREYVFYYNMHHIISDGWSINVLSRDVISYYKHFANGVTLDLPKLKIQYKDYTTWQLNQLENETYTNHKKYWFDKLSGDLPVLDLPNYKKRPSLKTYNGRYLTAWLDDEDTMAVKTYVKEKGGTLFMFLLSSLKVLFHRYTGLEDIVIGTPVAGRDHSDLENQIGFYLNTLALRNKINGNNSFDKFFQQVKQDLLEAYSNQMYPIDKVIEELNLNRDASRNALFDIMLVLQNTSEADSKLNGVNVDTGLIEDNGEIKAKFDIEFNFEEIEGYLRLILTYNTDVYDYEMITGLIKHYKAIVRKIVKDSSCPINKIQYISESEKKVLLYEYNNTIVNYSKDKTWIDFFEEQVLKTPDNIALRQNGEIVTYIELNDRANAIANDLIIKGIGSETNVGVLFNRGFDMVIALLGILKSGGSYVPIDPDYPVERQCYIAQNSKVSFVLSDDSGKSLEEKMPSVEFIGLPSITDENVSLENPKVQIASDQLAYTIYTSGSTGNPKGVMVEHFSLINLIRWVNDTFSVNESDRLLCITSVCFDLSVYDIFGMLVSGGSVYIATKEDFPNLEKIITNENITFWDSVPTTFNYLVDNLSADHKDYINNSLRLVFMSGDWIPVSLPDRAKQFFPKAEIISLGGATEGTIWSNYYPVNKVEEGWNSIPYGKPITNNFFYILDGNLQPVPTGVTGELFIGGVGVARGYDNDSEKTNAAFVKDPFNDRLGGRMYKTGDSGRWMPNGNMQFIGRKDNQVKIRGFRVELGEIESALSKYNGLKDSIVDIVKDQDNQNQLCAYLVKNDNYDKDELKAYLQTKMPNYMIPSYYVYMEDLPLNSNGKIDRKKLPKPNSANKEKSFYVPPTTVLQKAIAKVWKQILKIEKISVKDNFYDLGGDSLKAIRLISQYHKTFDVKLSITTIFLNTTLESHVELITEGNKEEHTLIEKVSKQTNYAISDAQRKLWMISQLEGGSEVYNMPYSIKLEGNYDVQNFKRAIKSVIERHEILRTVFQEDTSGEVRQVVLELSELGFDFGYEDYHQEKKPEILALNYIEEDSYKPFDLQNGPLLRVSLLQISNSECVLYYNMHHIISDGWSMDILSRDIIEYYNHFTKGTILDLPDLRIQYKDYAAWQLSQLKTETYKTHRKYWLDKFRGDLPVLNLSPYRQRPSLKTYNGKLLSTYMAKEDTNKVHKYVQDKGGTLFMFLLSSLKVLLFRYTGQEDIVLSSPIAGREHSDLKDQIGFYINTLPLKSNVKSSISFDEFYEQIKQDLLEAYTHQMYPFDRMIEELEKEEGVSKNDLFGIRVVLQNTSDADEKSIIPKDEIGVVKDYGATKAKFDILLVFEEIGDHIGIRVTYNTDIYDNDLIEGLINHYQALIREILKESNTQIKDLNYLECSEQSKLVYEGTENSLDFNEKTIIDLFKEQVEVTPNSRALVFENIELTYQELDEYSTKLAYYLIKNYGILPNDLIGLLMPTSDWSIISILAILKTGAAYVPIDPELPNQRIQYQIDNTKMKVLVTLSEDQEKTKNYDVDKFAVNGIWESLKNSTEIFGLPTIKQDTVAYVMYTSGSTGQPKGVMITHANLIDYVIGLFESIDIRTSKRFALMSNIATDLGNTVVYGALLSGGALYLPQKEALRNSEEIHEYFIKHEIDCIKIVPSHWQALTNGDNCLLPNHMIIFGGDKLSVDIVNRIMQQKPKMAIVNHYGPTETTIGKLLFQINTNIPYINIPIGRPFSQTSVYIVDKQMKPCPIGIPGELLIGGKGVAKGYLNQSKLTQQQFIQNPFTKKKERLYRTGDLVRMLKDGNIEFIGRIDNQVKIRGNRVELGAIESSLLSNEKIDEVRVLAKEFDSEDKELVAYYRGSGTIEPSALRTYLGDYLPSYMIPTYFVLIEEFPLTANGKIDLKALPDPTMKLSTEKQYLAPRNEKEQVLIEIWESVLKRENIGINDNFYDLGGDSIKSILIVSRLKQRGYGLKVGQLMKTPIVSKLAPDLTQIERIINQSSVNGRVSLLPIQSYFLSSDLLKNKSHYNQSVMLERVASIDFSLMNKSLELLIKHHDALRMMYTYEKGVWSQENQEETYKGHSLDLHDLSDSDNYQSEMTVLCSALQSSINIEKGPLVKAALFKLKTKDCFILIIHHLVVDGVSWRILLEDLENIYESLEKQIKISLPQKTDSYQRWAALLQEYASSEELHKEKEYWKNILSKEVSPIYKETDLIDLSNGNIKNTYFSLDQDIVELLQTRTHRVYNTEINDLLLAALGISIQKVFKENKVILDLEGHGREGIIDGVDVTRTVGWFTSIYPFVLDVGNEFLDYSTALIKVKESLRRLPNKGVGYGILRYLNNELDKELITSVLFNFLGDFGNISKEEGDNSRKSFVHSKEYRGAESSKENDNLGKRLRVSGMLVNGMLEMNLTYNDLVYEGEQVSDLTQTYKTVLTEMVQQLSQCTETYITPSDLTYKELSVSELLELNRDNNIEDVYELSPLQEGLFYHWISGKDKTTYCTQRSYRLSMPKINLDNVQKSYELLVKRHSVLRTGFTTRYGKLLQIVRKNFIHTYRFEDLSSVISKEDQELQVSYYKEKDRGHGFEVEQNSLIRLGVLDLGGGVYEFIWSYHHILMDGWCGSILINEFYQILMSIESNTPLSLPEITPYSSYIKWLSNIDKTSNTLYWKNYLSDYNEKAIVPFKNLKGTEQDYQAMEEVLKIESNQLDKLRAICAQYNVTENTFIQTVWGYLLSKYNNKQDVVFGVVVSGRPSEIQGVEDMVGLFINTVPVRVKYTGNMKFSELLEKQQQGSIASLDHHYLSLSEIQSDNLLGNELFDHIYVFENYAVNELDENFVETNNIDGQISVLSGQNLIETHYDFDILVGPGKASLDVKFRYNSQVYMQKDITQIRDHFENLMSTFISNAQITLEQVSCLTKNERTQIVLEFNDTKKYYRENLTVIGLFKEQVSRKPNDIAVMYGGKNLTFKEVDEYSDQLADALICNHQILPNDFIAIKLDRSEWMIISILAVLKTGGAYIPIDTQYPYDRIRFIQEDSKYRVCIDQDFINDFKTKQNSYSKPEIEIRDSLSGLAYGIYTSGSTGQPKGVLNSHEGIYNRLSWMYEYLGVTDEDIILQKTPYTFDVSVWELLLPMVTGCNLVFAKPEGHKDPKYLQQVIKENQISIIHFVPSMLGIFLENLQPKNCRSLRHVICSGEALPSSLVEDFKSKLPWTRIHNLYGPTEAAIDVTAIDLTDIDTKTHGVNIGKPVANTKIYIVDKHLTLQPVGVPGELLIEGVQVAKGYLNRLELNEEKFISSPFKQGERTYRTGDLASWLPNGEIKYLGRLDNQVKIRGNRIELGEIEAKIQSSGLVENVAVLVKESENTHKYLIAYVIQKGDYTEDNLYGYLKNHLPEYMIPSRITVLDEFPLTTSGKINRKELQVLNDHQKLTEQYIAPKNDLEEELVEIWKEILNNENISVRDNFFRIGGDSILSIRLISSLNKKYNQKLTIGQLYEFNTIESLSQTIEKELQNFDRQQKIKDEIEQNIKELRQSVLEEMDNFQDIEDVYPMSDIQKGMVVLSGLNLQQGVYHDQFMYQIPLVDKKKFKRAFSILIEKHVTLRTQLDIVNYNDPVQIVKKEIDFDIDYKDIKELPTKEKSEYISEYMLSERNNPFDLNSGLLWRISLFEINNTASIFLFQFHHAILDGWSIASLNTELFQIYKQLEQKTVLNVEKLKAKNRDAIIEELYDKRDVEIAGFWKTELIDYKKLDIFNDVDENQILIDTYDFDYKYKLESQCKKDKITLKSVLYGAFVYALNIINYENDFVVGMVTNNRPVIEDGEKLLGCFLNTIPVRNRLDNALLFSWSDYFKKTEDNLTRIKKNERLTLYEISKLNNEETIGGSPFFDVIFNYVNFHVYDSLKLENDISYNKSQKEEISNQSFEATNTALDLIANVSRNSLSLKYKLKRDLKNDITLNRISKYVKNILSTYLEHPETKVKETTFLFEEELNLLSKFNETSISYGNEITVLDKFASSVKNDKEVIAAVFEETTISYKELNEQSNQLAHYLIEKYKVKKNDLIGIQMDRSLEMLIAILGILKAGAGYVPLDMKYPDERVKYIKEDSAYKVLVDIGFITNFQLEKKNYSKNKPDVKVNEFDIAYAIYTSGSTGYPKGVVNSHAGLYNRLLWMCNDLTITENDIILQKTPYTFDVSVWELLMPSISGCKLVFARPDGHKDPEYLQQLIKENQISICHFVPSMLVIFLESLQPDYCRSLRHVICSGEALSSKTVEEFKKKLPWVSIHNLYGPTEAAIDVTSINLTNVDTKTQGVTIGKPVANTKIYIVDKNLMIRPIGVPGELLIEGVQVAKGYLERPELNTEKFIPSPFNEGEQIYRTGDLAKWLPNGEIAYIGRIDDQVKIRGNRIELGEIENRIKAFEFVENAVVLVKGEESDRKFLVGYLLASEGYNEDLLYDYLSTHLPDYMLPSRLIVLEEFPLTVSGKVNRKSFPDVDNNQVLSEQYVAPRNDLEEELVTIWKEVLNTEVIGVQDNFFRIGGDSLLVVKLKQKLEKKFNAAINIVDFFNHRTIEEQSKLFEKDIENEEVMEINELKF